MAVGLVTSGAAASDGGSANSPSALVIHAVRTTDQGKSERWSWCDAVHGRTRNLTYKPGGGLVDEHVTSIVAGTVRVDDLYYPGKQWRTSTVGSAVRFTLAGCEWLPSSIRRGLRLGGFAFAGIEKVEKVRTLHYRGLAGNDIWVQPGTYRIVKERDQTSTTRFTWLPASGPNLRKTQLVVPHGFSHQQS